MSNNKVVRVFTMEQQFPCGPKSSCCGPIGQSKEEVASLKSAIEGLGVEVAVNYIQSIEDISDQAQIFKLLRTFGHGAIPIITIGDEVVCMGQSEIGEVISSLKGKL